jgi:hypothetical protein
MATDSTSNNASPVQSSTRQQPQAVVRRDSQRPEAPRERAKSFGGPRLKLHVMGEIPGFHLYWENDEEGAIEQLLYEGFEFALPSEVRMASHIVQDADVADRVSRYVGKKEDGSPLRAYLLKCPDEVWVEREADRLLQADAWDEAIRAGKIQSDPSMYRPRSANIALDTKFRKEY